MGHTKPKRNKSLEAPPLMKLLPQTVVSAVSICLSAALLGGDALTFWIWWLLAFVMGIVMMPVTGRLFQNFDDKGWLFSKVFAILITGFLTWFLVSVKVLSFTTLSCAGVALACGVLCILLFFRQRKQGTACFPADQIPLIFWEEVIFFAFFLMWTYLAGFNPKAYGTEKFMDYGFMEAMMRSTTLPATDLWYSDSTINYYYGGQYFAVFLTKLTGSEVKITYNLMRTFVAGFTFALPFSLVRQMTKDRLEGVLTGIKKFIPAVSGLVAGAAVSIAGNMHYVIYRWILPWITKLTGGEAESYWFPDATRYIGYNPETSDQTIHEFPCYSFVLGDLHAHVVNILFVLPLIALLYAFHKQSRKEKLGSVPMDKAFWKQELLAPHILLISLMLGIFQLNNYWDFVIYFVVAGGTVLFTNIIRYEGRVKRILGVTAVQAVEVIAISYAAVIPFTIQFDSMVQGIALAQNHSLPYQLLVLWGLPTLLVILLIISVLLEKLKGQKGKKNVYTVMESITTPDLFAIILGLCAIGLVLIPEIVYVRDIYEGGSARANTMFKLTYQAYIMFGMTTGYGIFRLFTVSKQKVFKVLSGICLFFWIWTLGYFGNSVGSWFGHVFNTDAYQGLDATAFLETEFVEDADAIQWLKENAEGSPVVLEANGDSYTGYERVSAMTGLPTVLGWYVHEWLWRNDTADLNVRSADVESIYTSTDETYVQHLLTEYDVEYIFVGSMEREKYGDALNEDLLKSLGTIVFQDDTYNTYIIQIE